MPYTAFDTVGPQPKNTRGEMLSVINTDILTIRNILAALGFVQGFNYSHTGGTTEFPTNMLFTRSTEIIKVTITYFTSTKYSNYIPIRYAFYYSSDSGSNYYPIVDELGNYILNISYNVNDAVSSTTWSSS